jgi:hypothetical protein
MVETNGIYICLFYNGRMWIENQGVRKSFTLFLSLICDEATYISFGYSKSIMVYHTILQHLLETLESLKLSEDAALQQETASG